MEIKEKQIIVQHVYFDEDDINALKRVAYIFDTIDDENISYKDAFPEFYDDDGYCEFADVLDDVTPYSIAKMLRTMSHHDF